MCVVGRICAWSGLQNDKNWKVGWYWCKMETLFRSSKLALTYYFIIVDVATLWQRRPPASTTWWPDSFYMHHSSCILHYTRRLSNVLSYLTACNLLLPLLICLHPTRVIAIYTKTTHISSLGHGGCIIYVATLWQRWPPATTTWWPHPIYIILYIIY